jgi:DNA (cytosine-5)-methyltransferase 1
MNNKILSFFSGCGGLDLGFENAGFDVIWANDNTKEVMETYKKNFPSTEFNLEDINLIDPLLLPKNVIGIIGGPPCQSWSNAGKKRGMDDPRGKLFIHYISIVKEVRPLFVLAENVKGILSKRNKESFDMICSEFEKAGYDLFTKCVNASDYGVPQNRERVIFIGIRKDLKIKYEFPSPIIKKVSVRDSIGDLVDNVLPMGCNRQCLFPNHEYWEGSFSYIYMSRNRVLDWDGQSFTIQASGRQTSIHPQAPKMIKKGKDIRVFDPNYINLYRRLSVRECARLQTFPDDFIFYYNNINEGYKMIGNAVPVKLAENLAKSIKSCLPMRILKYERNKFECVKSSLNIYANDEL